MTTFLANHARACCCDPQKHLYIAGSYAYGGGDVVGFNTGSEFWPAKALRWNHESRTYEAMIDPEIPLVENFAPGIRAIVSGEYKVNSIGQGQWIDGRRELYSFHQTGGGAFAMSSWNGTRWQNHGRAILKDRSGEFRQFNVTGAVGNKRMAVYRRTRTDPSLALYAVGFIQGVSNCLARWDGVEEEVEYEWSGDDLPDGFTMGNITSSNFRFGISATNAAGDTMPHVRFARVVRVEGIDGETPFVVDDEVRFQTAASDGDVGTEAWDDLTGPTQPGAVPGVPGFQDIEHATVELGGSETSEYLRLSNLDTQPGQFGGIPNSATITRIVIRVTRHVQGDGGPVTDHSVRIGDGSWDGADQAGSEPWKVGGWVLVHDIQNDDDFGEGWHSSSTNFEVLYVHDDEDVLGEQLYVGAADDVVHVTNDFRGIARWDGDDWHPLRCGLAPWPSTSEQPENFQLLWVYALLMFRDEDDGQFDDLAGFSTLFIGGLFNGPAEYVDNQDNPCPESGDAEFISVDRVLYRGGSAGPDDDRYHSFGPGTIQLWFQVRVAQVFFRSPLLHEPLPDDLARYQVHMAGTNASGADGITKFQRRNSTSTTNIVEWYEIGSLHTFHDVYFEFWGGADAINAMLATEEIQVEASAGMTPQLFMGGPIWRAGSNERANENNDRPIAEDPEGVSAIASYRLGDESHDTGTIGQVDIEDNLLTVQVSTGEFPAWARLGILEIPEGQSATPGRWWVMEFPGDEIDDPVKNQINILIDVADPPSIPSGTEYILHQGFRIDDMEGGLERINSLGEIVAGSVADMEIW